MTRAVQRDHPMLDDRDENMPPHHQLQQLQAMQPVQRRRSRQAQRPFYDKAVGGLAQAQHSQSSEQEQLGDEDETESPIMPVFEELPIQRPGRTSQLSQNSQQYQQQLQQRQYQQHHNQLQGYNGHGHAGHQAVYEPQYEEEGQDHPGDMSAVEIHIDPATLDQDTEMASRFEQSRAKFEDPRYHQQQQYRTELDKVRGSRHRPPTPAPVTRPRGASINNGAHVTSTTAPEGMVTAAPDARMELLQREKYIHQKQLLQQQQQASQRPSAKTELLERSRQPSQQQQIQQQRQQQQVLGLQEREVSTGAAHPQLMRQSSAPTLARGVQANAAAAMRKRSREEEHQQKQQRQQDAYRVTKASKSAVGEDGTIGRQRAATVTSISATQVQPQPLTQQHLQLHEKLQLQEYRRQQQLQLQQQQQHHQGSQISRQQRSEPVDQHQSHHQTQQQPHTSQHPVQQQPQVQPAAQADPAKRKRSRTNPEQHHHVKKKEEDDFVFPSNIYINLVDDPEAGADWRALSDRQKLLRQFKIWSDRIEYGNVYADKVYDYRNVTLPKPMLYHISTELRSMPESRHDLSLRLLTEDEWRGVGVQMSRGWNNWTTHAPEPHVLMFRRTIEMSKQIRAEVKARALKEQEEAEAAAKAKKGGSRGVRIKKEEDGVGNTTTASRPAVEVKEEEEEEPTTLQLQPQPSHPQHQ